MSKEYPYKSVDKAIDFVMLSNCDWAEFGTAKGRSTEIIHKRLPKDVHLHLFDSFEGLPEDWLNKRGGVFQRKGAYKVEAPDWIFEKSNITVHKGLFEDTIPAFSKEQKKPLGFINIDCDLYSSTKTIFDNINDLIVKGTVIHFDEFYNYDGWELHEYKAFREYIDKYNRHYKSLGQSRTEKVWLEIVE